jgi:uncharacterized repeat protein (TIGR03943 family)
MIASIATRLQRLLAASPPLLLAVLVGKLWMDGTLRYYVNDRTVWIVLAGGALFGLVGAISIWTALRSPDGDRLSWRTLAFLLPICVGLAVPAHPLSATTGQASSLGALQLASHVSGGPRGDTFSSWISALADHPDRSWWQGRHVTLVGFVARQAGMPPRSFIVGRYLVTCCVVDATLLGFPIQIDGPRLPPQGAWVQVAGVTGGHTWTDPSGSQYPLVEHARILPVSIPSSPYLSP